MRKPHTSPNPAAPTTKSKKQEPNVVPVRSEQDLLDFFAAAALSGIISKTFDNRFIAKSAYDFAEVMLEEREDRIRRENRIKKGTV